MARKSQRQRRRANKLKRGQDVLLTTSTYLVMSLLELFNAKKRAMTSQPEQGPGMSTVELRELSIQRFHSELLTSVSRYVEQTRRSELTCDEAYNRLADYHPELANLPEDGEKVLRVSLRLVWDDFENWKDLSVQDRQFYFGDSKWTNNER